MTEPTERRPVIAFVTLETARIVRMPRLAHDDAAIRDYVRMLRQALSSGTPVEIPGAGPAFRFSATMQGTALLSKLTSTATGDDVVTIGVGLEDGDAVSLWRELHDGRKLSTRFDSCPPAPWCAVRLERGIVREMDAADWLDEFERCLAWACVA